MTWKKILNNPIFPCGTLATSFNERVQTDLFTLWNRRYVIWVDEATIYSVSNFLTSNEQDEYFRISLATGIRYFGAPLALVSDQEGAVISDMYGRVGESFSMKRDLAGSDGHTRSGIAERRLGIVKLGALKLYAQVQKQDMRATQDECVYESTMCTNSVLVYSLHNPNQAVLGFEPRELYTIGDDSLCA